MKELLINLEEEGIKPEYGDLKKAHFESGYESYEFYNAILKTAKKRLYVFGRKNRKLFSKNNTKIKKLIEDGIDFKCLFLSDKSNASILKIAQENEKFSSDLEKIILGVKERYKDNLDMFKKYDFQQLKRIIVVDDCFIFVPVTFVNGNVKHFTKTEFDLYDANDVDGMNLINDFNKVWSIAKPL